MSDSGSGKAPLATAPSEECSSSRAAGHPPVVQNTPIEQVAAPPPPGFSVVPPTSAAYPEPPPSYQAAMSYPSQPVPQPSANPNYPKQNYHVPPGYAPYPPPPPAAAPIHVNVGGFGGFPPDSTAPRPVIVHVVQSVPGELRCAHCADGVVVRETDMCCLVCLILLAIFTFPFGLVFLCCVPCTVRRRCSNCNRIG